MEWPSVVLFALVWIANPEFPRPMVRLLGILWLIHYLQRTFLFTSLLRDGGKRQSLLTVALANVFNVLNATGNAAALTDRPFDSTFIGGLLLFSLGFGLNLHSDHVLRSLRAPGETGYKIPSGGGFSYVSAPNYLGEILEWVGFALAAQTLAACSNLPSPASRSRNPIGRSSVGSMPMFCNASGKLSNSSRMVTKRMRLMTPACTSVP
jgi:hypothetical protein